MQEKCRRGADSEIALSILPKIERLLINKEAIKKTFCERGGRISPQIVCPYKGDILLAARPAPRGLQQNFVMLQFFYFPAENSAGTADRKMRGEEMRPLLIKSQRLEVKGQMSKKKKLDLSNPKIVDVVRTFSLVEGRMSRDEIIEKSSKDIFYQLKNNGFIEAGKDKSSFKATSKMKRLSEKYMDSTISVGCSSGHSEVLSKCRNIVPDSIIKEGRFRSGNEIRQEMQAFKKTDEYKAAIDSMVYQNRQEQLRAVEELKNYQGEMDREYYLKALEVQKEIDWLRTKEDMLLSQNAMYIPDFQIVDVSRGEVEQLLSLMEERLEDSRGREHEFLEHNIQALKSVESYELVPVICFEAVTDHYSRLDIERHITYEQVMNQITIYIS